MRKFQKNEYGIIENLGENRLLQFLENGIPSCEEVDVAIAFVSWLGLKKILNELAEVAQTGRVRFLTGLMNYVTEPRALKAMLHLTKRSGGRVQARISTEPHFHCKSFFLSDKRLLTAVIGSSNLTQKGLSDYGELNIVVTVPRNSAEAARLRHPFRQHWDNSVELQVDPIKRYATEYDKHAVIIPNPPVRKILGITSARSRDLQQRTRRYWSDSVVDVVGRETSKIVKQFIARRSIDYDWFVSENPRSYKKGDLIVQHDFYSARTTLNELVFSTQLPRRTEDGRYCFGIKRLSRTAARSHKPNLWKQLKREGLFNSQRQARKCRRISKGKWAKLRTLFRS